MGNSKTTIRALFKDGVFRPLDPLDLPDDSTVEITVDPQGAQKRLDDLFKKIHALNRKTPIEEIEQDVERVIREVREEQ
jgi:predicted DNA-binding antitoxin AbrB/MazE fold protein